MKAYQQVLICAITDRECLKDFSWKALVTSYKYISRNSPFSGIWENIIHQEEDDLPGETKELMAEYLFPRLKKLCSEQGENSLFFLYKSAFHMQLLKIFFSLFIIIPCCCFGQGKGHRVRIVRSDVSHGASICSYLGFSACSVGTMSLGPSSPTA